MTRFGSGRAIAVAASGSVMVIATTIGVDLLRSSGSEALDTTLPSPLADVLVAPDGGSALLVATSGAAELWSLDIPLLLASFDSVESARFADDGASVDVIGADTVSRSSTTDGSTIATTTRDRSGAVTSTAWFGSGAQALVVAGGEQRGSGEIWTGAEMVDAGLEPDVVAQVGRAIGDPTGDRVVLGLAGDNRFAGSLVSVDLATGEPRWSHDVGDDASRPSWDVGSDGRVLAVVDMEAQLVGLDGTVENSWELQGDESVVSVMSLGATPGYVIVRAGGTVVFVDADGVSTAEVASSGERLVDPTPTVSPGGIIASDVDGRVRRWAPAGEVVAEVTQYLAGRINDVAISADGSTAAAAASDGNVALLDLGASSSVEPMPEGFVHAEGNVDAVAFAPDGTAVVTGVSEANGENSFDDTLSRWDLVEDERRFAVGGIPEPIMGCTEFRNVVRFSPDGSFFVAPFHDFSVSMRDAADGSVIHEFPEHISIVWGLSISPDGALLATSSDDWTVRLWNLDDFSLASEIEAPPGGFLDVAFAPDGATLVVSDISGNVHTLDIETGVLSPAFDGTKDPQARLSVSPDGRYVAAGSHDGGSILIWDMTSGRVVQALEGHAATVNSVEFSPDGGSLVSGSNDGTVRRWTVS